MTEIDFHQLNEKIWASGVRRDDLVQRVANALREQIEQGIIPIGTKLMPEAELAKQLNISRPSLREAIRILAHDGHLQVKHGVGTFVSKASKPMFSPLEQMRSMTDLIRNAGGTSGHRDLQIEQIAAVDKIAAELGVEEGAPLGRIRRVRLIDDLPFVYGNEYLVLQHAEKDFGVLSQFAGGSIYQFLRERFSRPISHSKLRVSAVAADTEVAGLLHLKRGAPLLRMQELHLDNNNVPMLLSVNYHNTEVVEFTSMRAGMPT
ncbi:GntR family transcriptional regulator [Devosia faecipullorum]|uniref:GntR family transcriptional regulator n=1 Tax=Devosia faecipullorum TaxID=2755039 RepID=UPI00187B17E6|nr:GntR family transcriptional regulator [Devosia faecipullorum]